MTVTIAIDCMGGDHGPTVTVPAGLGFLKNHRDARIVFVGLEDQIRPLIPAGENDRVSVRHASEVVTMHDSPALAIRNKKNSSMRVAVNLVHGGEANACVSAGNTGALMAISRFVLKMLPGIDRPAICATLPTIKGHTRVLDLGANVDCEAENFLQFGVMAANLVAALEHKERPSVGLLNIGEEEIKGNEIVKEAAELLRESGLNFIGNIEGDGIYKGAADVVVCDGFVGNVALKTSEGLAQMITTRLREEFDRNVLTRLVGFMALPVLRAFKRRLDHRRYNGASLLGLKGIVIKSHGSADAFSFEHALGRAYEEVKNNVLSHIADSLQKKADDRSAAEELRGGNRAEVA